VRNQVRGSHPPHNAFAIAPPTASGLSESRMATTASWAKALRASAVSFTRADSTEADAGLVLGPVSELVATRSRIDTYCKLE
jgi:hypothetical protein